MLTLLILQGPDKGRRFELPDAPALLGRESRQIPLNPQVKLDAIKHLEGARSVRPLPVDFVQAAESWKQSQEFLVKEFSLR